MGAPLLLSPQMIDKAIASEAYHEFVFFKDPPHEKPYVIPQSKAVGCGRPRCSKLAKKQAQKAATSPVVDYNEIKRCIMSLTFDQQQRLKELFSCTSLKLHYRDRRNAMQRRVI